MADSNTEAATPTSESGVQKGSEFSKPVGAKDDEVWARHFGKDAKEAKGKTEKKSLGSSSDNSARSIGADAKKSSESRSAKAPDESTKRSDTATKPSREPTSEKEASTPKDTKSDKTTDKTKSKDPSETPTGGKTAEETDPEAPSKKARDLYLEAKKAEDPREARKLYKRAMKEAFGEVPEEFDDSRYAAVRKERKAANAALEEKAAKNEGRFKEAVEKLKPAIHVMRMLEGAKLADKLTVPLVEKTLHVMAALRSIEDGDFTQLAEVVSRAAGVDHDEAMKRFIRGTKISPESRQLRAAQENAQRENQALKEQLQRLEAKLTEGQTQQTEAQKKAAHDKEVADNRARWIDDITTELDGHPALKLPRGAERVLAYLIRTANPQTKAPRYSFEEAGNRIVAAEKKRLQEARHLLDDGDGEPTREAPRRISGVSRTETAEAGVRNESPEASFERIFAKHASGGRR